MAQVYHYKLYASEVRQGMPVGLSQEDSLALASDFIDSWVKEKLVLHEAEKRLAAGEKNFSKEMMDYRCLLTDIMTKFGFRIRLTIR